MRSSIKFFLILAFIPMTSAYLPGQDGEVKSKEEKVNILIDYLYTIEDFQERLANYLDNNPDFASLIEDEDLMTELSVLVRESALGNYVASINTAFADNLREPEVDSLILLLESPYGPVVKKAFSLDNRFVEKDMGVYVNYVMSKAGERMHQRDSLLFLKEYPVDLSEIMDGVYLDTLFNGLEVRIERNGGKQVETAVGLDLNFRVEWLSNSHYYLIKADDHPINIGPDTIKVNIYEVEGTRYKYIVKSFDGTYEKTEMTKRENITYTEEILSFQYDLNQDYLSLDPEDSPLDESQRQAFKEIGGHSYFTIDPRYRVEAAFEVYEHPDVIEMKTSTSRLATYKVYGKASFVLEGRDIELLVYQSQDLTDDPEYADYLFLPFRDLTSGEETYGGGRYIDLTIPKDNSQIVIDFNRSYQPYCAYNDGYSCPVPPAENFVDLRLEAGVKSIDLGEK